MNKGIKNDEKYDIMTLKRAILIWAILPVGLLAFVVIYFWGDSLKKVLSNLIAEPIWVPILIMVLSVLGIITSGYIYKKLFVASPDGKGYLSKSYIMSRLSILTYALYEMILFFMLTLILYAYVPMPQADNGKMFAVLTSYVGKVLLFSLVISFIIKFLFKESSFLKRRFSNITIRENSQEGMVIKNIQTNVNAIFTILILAFTFQSFLGLEPERVLKMIDLEKNFILALIIIVASNSTFLITKSEAFNFFIEKDYLSKK